MKINYSGHSVTQALDRDLLDELRAGVKLIQSAEVDLTGTSGEVNFIVEVKSQVLRRQGSSGDLVIIGIDVDNMKVKSVFLQHSDQVEYRKQNGRVYRSLVE